MNLKDEDRQIGRDNYYEALGVTRRDFLKGVVASGAVAGAGLGSMYFGYGKVPNPVRIGVIGTGDEGNVLIGALNPAYAQVVAIADIRPFNIFRAFHGDWDSEELAKIRTGLIAKYGWKGEDEARKHVKVYDQDYKDLINDKNVEAVIIALPLHLHAKVALEAMAAGKHVLTEKLMAHTVGQCKEMAKAQRATWESGGKQLYLAVGHQRHYSVLYDNAVHLMQWGLLGQLHHIRAQWHRGNKPGGDSWSPHLPTKDLEDTDNPIVAKLSALENDLDAATKAGDAKKLDLLKKQRTRWEKMLKDIDVDAAKYGYEEVADLYGTGYKRSALEELIRWRLFDRTSAGLMAELGSHQLDAASIFCSALRKDGKKSHPLSVHAVGGRHLFPPDRDAEDHVYCMFEFPAPAYDLNEFDVGYEDKLHGYPDTKKGIPGYSKEHPEKKVVVTYSSINGNGFGGYGEVVMGTKGTLILERETELMLFSGGDTSKSTQVTAEKKGGAVLDTQHSGPQKAAPIAKAAEGPPSKGYQEEIEHWAWCIRNPAAENKPKCHPEVAMADAIIALTTRRVIRRANAAKFDDPVPGYTRFREEWFDVNHPATPEEDIKVE